MHQCALCNDNNGINQTSRLDIKIDKLHFIASFLFISIIKSLCKQSLTV